MLNCVGLSGLVETFVGWVSSGCFWKFGSVWLSEVGSGFDGGWVWLVWLSWTWFCLFLVALVRLVGSGFVRVVWCGCGGFWGFGWVKVGLVWLCWFYQFVSASFDSL